MGSVILFEKKEDQVVCEVVKTIILPEQNQKTKDNHLPAMDSLGLFFAAM